MAWFCIIGADRVGPVGDSELVALFGAGRLNPSSLVWREGMAEWRAALQVADLPPGCLSAVVPLPPPPVVPVPPVAMPPQAPSGEDAAISMLVPVGVDGFALAAGYLALLSPLMFVALLPSMGALRVIFAIPGVLALVLGVIALRRLKQKPSARGSVRAWMGVGVPGGVLATMLVLYVAARAGVF